MSWGAAVAGTGDGERSAIPTAPLRHREQRPIALAPRRLLHPDPGMDVGRYRRYGNELERQVERIGKACGPQRFLSRRCPQPVVDVDEQRLDPEGGLSPPQHGGERQRVAPAGKSDDDAITGCESGNAGAGQQTLLDPVRRLPAGSLARPRGRRRALGSIAACVIARGVHLVPTGGIEPPAKGL
jgi:hypothetical protein